MKTLTYIHDLGELFEQVQLNEIFSDGKTFTDCLPKHPLDIILAKYTLGKNEADFSLRKFIDENFTTPKPYKATYTSDVQKSAQQHIENLWNVLLRTPDNEHSSLIHLPYPYIVPGGRFGEIYYWDSYFTMLGLQVSGRTDILKNMVANFAFLIDNIGYIPNGNRGYFIGRSQPPFFALMIQLLADEKGHEMYVKYLPQLEKEYDFWMRGESELSAHNQAVNRVVLLDETTVLNRYWDFNDTPRPESYKEDVELAAHSSKPSPELYRHLRAAAESGWDFSTRWFANPNDFGTIHTTDYIPVDLNCLLLNLEKTIAKAYRLSTKYNEASVFEEKAQKRKDAILKYCWSEEESFFVDYDFVAQMPSKSLTLAASFPLFFKIANPLQAAAVAEKLEYHFLKVGGLITSLENSGQQWDSPNGWAPLHWISYQGLMNYQLKTLAQEIKKRWVNVNLKVYEKTGKMTEKYDVCNENLEASGGEYPNQEGFGWTNGVLLKMLKEK